MSKLIVALVLFLTLTLQVTPALASCTTHTYLYGGRMVTCMQCCYFGNCQTTCY